MRAERDQHFGWTENDTKPGEVKKLRGEKIKVNSK